MSYSIDSSHHNPSLSRHPPAYSGTRGPPPHQRSIAAQPLGLSNASSTEQLLRRDRFLSATLDRYQRTADTYQPSATDRFPQIQSKDPVSSQRFPLLTEGYQPPLSRYRTLGSQSSNPPPPYNGYHQTTKMNGSREHFPTSKDYDNISSADSINYQGKGYPGTLSRNTLNRDLNLINRDIQINGKNYSYDKDYPISRNLTSASKEYDENNVRDYSSSTNNSEILDLARDMAQRDAALGRETTLPRDQSLNGFSRNFGNSPRDFRISRESLDKPNRTHTPPSRHSQTPPSLHSATPPSRHSQASPLRLTQTPPRSAHTPPFRPIQNHTPPLTASGQLYSMSPKLRYRTAEEYHYDYRGGYRPMDSEGGYTTDGSGSGGLESGSLRGILDSGSIRGFSNFLYPEHEALLPRDRSSFPPYQAHGAHYAKGEH